MEKFFIEAIGSILKLVPSQNIEQGFNGQAALENDSSTFLQEGDVITQDGDRPGQSLNVVLGPNKGNIYARLIPKKKQQINIRDIRSRIIGAPGLSVSTQSANGSYGNNRFGYVDYAIDSNSNSEKRIVVDFVQFFKTGEVWCINGSVLGHDNNIWEGNLSSVINKMLEVIKSWLNNSAADVAYSLVIGLSGLTGKRVAYGHSNYQKPSSLYVDHFEVKFDNPKDITTQNVKDVLWKKIENEF